jgi:GNAT superfamily N-acetyltransferase
MLVVGNEVHTSDGYPLYLVDMRSFLVSADVLCAWVIEEGGQIVGHVALHRRSTEAVMATATRALGLPPERLGVVARLFVVPGQRGKGFGRALLATAAQAARARGMWPVLDVVAQSQSAIDLYESCGWTCAGRVVFRAPDGREFEELVYLAPPGDNQSRQPDASGAG